LFSQGFADNSRILDMLFVNINNVSYIDPSFDRCAAAHEWLSTSDVYRSNKTTSASSNSAAHHTIQNFHIPTAAAVVHLLCRVEQRLDLVYTARDLADSHYRLEANTGLTQKFAEGLSPQAGGSRSVEKLATETIPYALWVLSAGEGTSSLDRVTSSLELLNNGELQTFHAHAATLHHMGLTYVTIDEGPTFGEQFTSYRVKQVRLEPPIDLLLKFDHFKLPEHKSRREIPPGMKLLLAHQASQNKMRSSRRSDAENQLKKFDVCIAKEVPLGNASLPDLPKQLLKRVSEDEESPPAKRMKEIKVETFLGIGARKAKAAKANRKAAGVGFERFKKNKLSHTGSGEPFSHILRLKYVKGFTEAVRAPCRLKDLP
jgi:chromosome transmission fidelity protein 18